MLTKFQEKVEKNAHYWKAPVSLQQGQEMQGCFVKDAGLNKLGYLAMRDVDCFFIF